MKKSSEVAVEHVNNSTWQLLNVPFKLVLYSFEKGKHVLTGLARIIKVTEFVRTLNHYRLSLTEVKVYSPLALLSCLGSSVLDIFFSCREAKKRG